MNIILGADNAHHLQDRYIVLELDRMTLPGSQEPISAFCVIEQPSLNEMVESEQFIDLHRNLIKNYRIRNWKYCDDALEHLIGKWSGQLDSFYLDLKTRISVLKEQSLDGSWSDVIDKTKAL